MCMDPVPACSGHMSREVSGPAPDTEPLYCDSSTVWVEAGNLWLLPLAGNSLLFLASPLVKLEMEVQTVSVFSVDTRVGIPIPPDATILQLYIYS